MTDDSNVISFKAILLEIKQSTIVRLPEAASKKLPSRGQAAVKGTINGCEFNAVVEPDGYWGHWVRVDAKIRQAAGVMAGDTVEIVITPVKEWPEPVLPDDFKKALFAAPKNIQELWKEITPMARWEWVRWVNATRNLDTRHRRVDVSISKLKNGKRRPCCFNLAACTDPELSKNGRLIETD